VDNRKKVFDVPIGDFQYLREVLSSTKHIFHFTSAKTFIKHILRSGQLRFSLQLLANDPVEANRRHFYFDKTENDLVKDVETILTINHLNDLFHETIFSKVAQICFSRNSFVGQYIRSVALVDNKHWAHYGDNHRGICLIFDREKFQASFRALGGQIRKWSGEVQYYNHYKMIGVKNKNEAYYIPVSELKKIATTDPSSFMLNKIDANAFEYFFSKDDSWASENEYRVVILPHQDEEIFIDLLPSLEHIVTGAMMNADDYDQVDEFARNFGAKIHLSSFHFEYGRYHLFPNY
jgi:hypothetical protein